MKKLVCKYVLLALLCPCVNPVYAQLSGDNLLFGRIDVEDGLSSNAVYAIIQDDLGFLWFGTDNGLNRYDGYNFKIFRNDPADSNSISGDNIWALMLDNAGNIWIGTKEGVLNRYNPETEIFTKWQFKEARSEENSITCLYQDKQNNIWIGTYRGGLYKLDLQKNDLQNWSSDPNDPNSLSYNYVRSISEDNSGNMLIATYYGLNKFNPAISNDFQQYYHNPFDKNSISNNIIWSLSKSSLDSNIIWLGTANGLTKYNLIENTFSRVDIPNPQNLLYGTSAGIVIEEIIHDEKIIWVNSYAGLLRKNLDSGETNRFLRDENNLQSLIDDQINEIFKDRSDVIWIATDNGLSYLSPKNSRFSSVASSFSDSKRGETLLKKNVTAITETPDKKLWFGATDGLYYANPENKTVLSFHGFKDTPVWSLVAGSKNDLWAGTFGAGLKQIDLQTGIISSRDLDYPQARTQARYYNKSLLKDSKNNIWIGYWGVGASRYNPSSGEYENWMNDPENPKSISNNDVWVIKEDRFGRIWLGTRGGGLNLAYRQAGLFEDADEVIFHHWGQKEIKREGLSSNSIYSICEAKYISSDENETVLWIGTSNGLNKFVIKNKGEDLYNFNVDVFSFSIKDGSPDNSIKSIVEDNNGNLWLGTGQGLSFFNTKNNTFTNFTTADGLPGSVFNFESAIKTDNNRIFMGTTQGAIFFDPNEITMSAFNPPVVITNFFLFNNPVKAGKDSPLKKSILLADSVILTYSQNVFSFEFAALDYNSPQSIQYAYIMEGFDKEWIYSGSGRLAIYTNLDPGEYLFKVKATNADGIWNENDKSVSIIIKPPFWMTWWFRGILIFAFLSLGPIIYYRRVSQLKKEKTVQVEFSKQLIQSQEDERKRIASELHDSLGQDLLVIKNLALLNKNKDDQFEEISKTASLALDEVRRISYNLHPYQLDRLGLSKAFSSMFGNIEGASKIKFDLQVDNIDNLLSKDKEINIFRIVQECVNNILKHSGASIATVTVQHTENQIRIEIADNGKGFDYESAKEQSKGLGLKNLVNRVSLLDGVIDYSSTSEFATLIKIQIPVNNEQ